MDARDPRSAVPGDRTILAILVRYVGDTRAPGVLARARRELPGQRGPLPARQQLGRLGDALRTLLGEADTRRAVAELTQLFTAQNDVPKSLDLEIRVESDVARARLAARDLSQALGSSPLVLQKLATIVSELARNMVTYAGGGTLTIRKVDGERRSVQIVARDHGPGIPNLEDILAGRYKSRSGLGLGILGTKRLADRFAIQSSPAGTHIDVEVTY